MTAELQSLRLISLSGSEPAGLSATDQARLWRLARRLLECQTVAEAETLARDASQSGWVGSADVARAIAETVGLVLSSLEERERLRSLVIRDPLTGLFNRRYLEEELGRQIDRARRLRSALAVAIVDLDHFRDYNEHHGHPAGDLVLQLVGLLLQGFRRGDDVPCRYGGEEFVLIMPAVTGAEAVARLDPLRAALAETAPHREGRPLPPVTASVGVAAFPDHGGSVADLLEAADTAMYRAKRAGRNRVCAAGKHATPHLLGERGQVGLGPV
jgi:diguanylate cyclase (GGDEF)-like protein